MTKSITITISLRILPKTIIPQTNSHTKETETKTKIQLEVSKTTIGIKHTKQ